MGPGQVGSLALLSAGMGGLAILYIGGVLLIAGITLPLLKAYVYSANRTLAQICYAATLIIVFPGLAFLGNHSYPPDYVGGFREIAGVSLWAFEADGGTIGNRIITFIVGLPVPSLAVLVVVVPFLRPMLIARPGARHHPHPQ